METLDSDTSNDRYSPSTSLSSSSAASEGEEEEDDVPRLTLAEKGKGKAIPVDLKFPRAEDSDHDDHDLDISEADLQWYRQHFHLHALHLHSHPHGALTETHNHPRPFHEPPTPTHARPARSTLIPPANEYWSPRERTLLFPSLSRHSRHRPDLIALDIGTKTEAQVVWYLETLRVASVVMNRERRGRTGGGHSAGWGVWREGFAPGAREVEGEWVEREEGMARLLAREAGAAGGEGVKERRRQRVREADMAAAKRAWKKRIKDRDPTPTKEEKKEMIHAEIERIRIHVMRREERWAAEDWLVEIDEGKMAVLGREVRSRSEEREKEQLVDPHLLLNLSTALPLPASTSVPGPQLTLLLTHSSHPPPWPALLTTHAPRLLTELSDETELDTLLAVPAKLRTPGNMARVRQLKEAERARRGRRVKVLKELGAGEEGEGERGSEVGARVVLEKGRRREGMEGKGKVGPRVQQVEKDLVEEEDSAAGSMDGTESGTDGIQKKKYKGGLRREKWLSDYMVRTPQPYPLLLPCTGLLPSSPPRTDLTDLTPTSPALHWKHHLKHLHSSPNAYVPSAHAVIREQLAALEGEGRERRLLEHGNSRPKKERRSLVDAAGGVMVELGLDFLDLRNLRLKTSKSISADTLCWLRAQVVHNLRHLVLEAIELQEHRNSQSLVPSKTISNNVIADVLENTGAPGSTDGRSRSLPDVALRPTQLDFGTLDGDKQPPPARFPERTTSDPIEEAIRRTEAESDIFPSETDDSDWSVDDREEKVERVLEEVDELQDRVYEKVLESRGVVGMGEFDWGVYRYGYLGDGRGAKRKRRKRGENSVAPDHPGDDDKSSTGSKDHDSESDKSSDDERRSRAPTQLRTLQPEEVELEALQEDYRDKRLRLTKTLARRDRGFDNHGTRLRRRRPRTQRLPPTSTAMVDDGLDDTDDDEEEARAMGEDGMPHWWTDEQRATHLRGLKASEKVVEDVEMRDGRWDTSDEED